MSVNTLGKQLIELVKGSSEEFTSVQKETLFELCDLLTGLGIGTDASSQQEMTASKAKKIMDDFMIQFFNKTSKAEQKTEVGLGIMAINDLFKSYMDDNEEYAEDYNTAKTKKAFFSRDKLKEYLNGIEKADVKTKKWKSWKLKPEYEELSVPSKKVSLKKVKNEDSDSEEMND
jgi:hypothetical protein